jgi:hypothetical protein
MTRNGAWAQSWSILRLAMAAAILAAVITQLAATTGVTLENNRDLSTTLANFFSYFTILSNVGASIVLAWAGTWYLTRGRTRPDTAVEPRGLAVAVASVTTYMIVTGVVYNVLLRGIELPIGSRPVPWSNEVLHLIGPLFLLADLFVAPRRRRLRNRAVWIIIVFPIAWTAYTLVRGPFVTNPTLQGVFSWYPYPFLDPDNFDNGYFGVAIYVVIIAAVIVGASFFVVWIGRRRTALAFRAGLDAASPAVVGSQASPGRGTAAPN